MDVVLNVALPIFAIMLAGYVGGRTVIGGSASQSMSLFVYWFALPAVLFIGMARQPLDQILNWNFIGAFLGGMLLVFLLAGLFGRVFRWGSPSDNVMQALNASFSNTGYMGIPLFIAAFGTDRTLPAIIATVIMSSVMVGLGVVGLEVTAASGRPIRRVLGDVFKALLRNPLIIASAAGLAWNAVSLPIPQALATFCDILGGAAAPGALFAIGAFLATRRFETGIRTVGWMVPFKLLVQPALTWLLIVTVFPLDRFWTGSAVLLAALPTGALTFVVASQYKVYVDRTSQIIMLSTLASVPVLSGLIWYYAA